nr:retrovirus-related Pol polyprotein from transposon TNT 1-94 [Tanacetum cinerariifolium]
MYEKKIKFVEQPIGPAPDLKIADPDTIDKYYKTVNLEQEVACLMLSSMPPDLQRTLEKYNAYDMLKELKTILKSRQNKNCLNQLKHSTLVNRRKNYNMHNMGKTIVELQAMLKLHEKGIPKKDETLAVLSIREGKIQKDKRKPQGVKGKDKGKNKFAYALKLKISPLPKRDNLTKDSICHHYKEGHRRSKKLKHGALSMYMGKGMRATVEANGSFDLILPSGLIIVLDNYHFAPTVTRGGEYLSHEFVNRMKSCGIVSQLTPPYTPQHNGVSKRMNQTLLDMVRSMMNLTTLPKSFWGYALEYAARILNMVPTKKVERTPYEIWHGKAPKLSYLSVWGCKALLKRDVPDKLDPRSIKCIFVGYPKETIGYYFYYPPDNKMFVA